MTFLEKAKESFPNMEVLNTCPWVLGLESRHNNCDAKCSECWNREMPGTEPKVDKEEEWFNRGFKEGTSEGLTEGMNCAWELAKRVVRSPKVVENAQIFLGKNIVGIERESLLIQFFELTPQEALAKLKAYEDSKIEVGDVIAYAGEKSLVLDIKGSKVVVLTDDGCVQEWYECDVEKTGKHIDIQSILEQIG